MTLADIRSRLAGLEGRTYWRSLEELAETPEFTEYVGREFPAQASEFTDPAGRRQFLKLMGASLALAGVSACTRQPEERIVPYVRQPEELVPGRPLFYATAMTLGGFGYPLLAENHMGRPTKVEGNPDHPASMGATDTYSQASVLTLYDPDRSRNILNRGEVKTWNSFVAAMQALIAAQRSFGGTGFRLLTEPITSPTLAAQIKALQDVLPDAQWHQWDAVYGAAQDGAPAAHAIYRFDKADVVVSLDADFLGLGAGSVRYAKDFSSRRRMGTAQDRLNRLYVAEPVLTVTGANAEHRLALKARDVHAFAAAIAAAVGANVSAQPGSSVALSAVAQMRAAALCVELDKINGRDIAIHPVEPMACPTMTRAPFVYDHGDTAGYTPLLPMHSLGHAFVPPPIHAGGLRYHGMAPTVSQLVDEGLCEPKAVTQTEAYEAGVLWARSEGFIPAPETTNALAQVVKEARQAKEEGREKTIVVNWSGHGLLDLGAYDRYFAGELNDVAMSDDDLRESQAVFAEFPKPQALKSRS